MTPSEEVRADDLLVGQMADLSVVGGEGLTSGHAADFGAEETEV